MQNLPAQNKGDPISVIDLTKIVELYLLNDVGSIISLLYDNKIDMLLGRDGPKADLQLWKLSDKTNS
jgi:hypothetical protein